jgi:hypothetical protein
MKLKVFAAILLIFSLSSCATLNDQPKEATKIASTIYPA